MAAVTVMEAGLGKTVLRGRSKFLLKTAPVVGAGQFIGVRCVFHLFDAQRLVEHLALRTHGRVERRFCGVHAALNGFVVERVRAAVQAIAQEGNGGQKALIGCAFAFLGDVPGVLRKAQQIAHDFGPFPKSRIAERDRTHFRVLPKGNGNLCAKIIISEFQGLMGL